MSIDKSKATIFMTLIITLILAVSNVHSTPFEVDVTATVYKVIDGDTFDAFPVGRVRLADIDAPEKGVSGYYEAKYALTNLTLNRKVYLDVDDLHVKDRYNRIVCVVYVRYNSTHLLNVNMYLLYYGYAALDDYDNEFDPSAWEMLAYYPEEWETMSVTTTTKYLNLTKTQTVTLTTGIPTTITSTTKIPVTKTVTSTATYTSTKTNPITLTATKVTTITTSTTKLITMPITTTKTIQTTVTETVSVFPPASDFLIGLAVGIVIGLALLYRYGYRKRRRR